MTTEKMYMTSSMVKLPENIPVSSVMYKMSRFYELPNNVKETYYDGQIPTMGMKSGISGNVNGPSSTLKVMEVNSCGETTMESLKNRQENILEKLQMIKKKLSDFKTPQFNSVSASPSSAEFESLTLAHQQQWLCLIRKIDALKLELIEARRKSDQHEQMSVEEMEKWQMSILKQLLNLRDEMNDVAVQTHTALEVKREEDLKSRQMDIIYVIDALQCLLQSDVASLQNKEEHYTMTVEEYHNNVLKLIEALQEEFSKVMRAMSGSAVEKIGVLQDLVISSSPANPPYFLIPLKKLLQSYNVRVLSTCTTHSSVDQVDPKLLKLFREEICKERSSHDLSFTVILKNQNKMSLMVNPLKQSAISGEANILRYISRLFPASSCVNFEAQGSFVSVSETDYWLDATQSKFLQGNNKERQSHLKQLNSKLGTETWLSGSTMGLFDVFSWSVILQAGLEDGLPSNVSAWFKRMNDTIGFERGTETPPLSNTSDVSQTSMKRDDLELFLKKNDIKFQSKNHEEVFTVEALMNCVNDMPGMHMKNLFLKDKKKNLYLLAAKHDAKVQLSNVGNQVGAKDLRFGDEETLYQTLGVKQGCVTVFALINDPTHRVKLLLDDQIMNTSEPFVNFHPLTNDATLGISPKDMQKFIHLTGHEIQLVHL